LDAVDFDARKYEHQTVEVRYCYLDSGDPFLLHCAVRNASGALVGRIHFDRETLDRESLRTAMTRCVGQTKPDPFCRVSARGQVRFEPAAVSPTLENPTLTFSPLPFEAREPVDRLFEVKGLVEVGEIVESEEGPQLDERTFALQDRPPSQHRGAVAAERILGAEHVRGYAADPVGRDARIAAPNLLPLAAPKKSLNCTSSTNSAT
jgi:hypothetical protein